MPVSLDLRQNDGSPTDCFGCAMVMAGVGLLAVAGIARLVEKWRH